MKLELKSDFSEFYDSYFDLNLHQDFSFKTFRRITTDGPDRLAMFSCFRLLGIPTPKYGYLLDFQKFKFSPDLDIVVYTNPNVHCGEGKELMSFRKFVNSPVFHGFLISEYISNCSPPLNYYISKSTRYLFIGKEAFIYDYVSFSDWRSNCGDGDILNFRRIDTPNWRKSLNYPLLAIDFVGTDGNLHAIDLNVAPGIFGVPVKSVLTGEQIVNLIKNWIEEYG